MVKCSKHPHFRGLRLSKTVRECPDCVEYYKFQREQGVKERRKSRKPAEISTVDVPALPECPVEPNLVSKPYVPPCSGDCSVEFDINSQDLGDVL